MDLSSLKKNKAFYNEPSILSVTNLVEWKKKRRIYNFNFLPKTAILTLSRNGLNWEKRFFLKKTKGLSGKNYIINKNYLYCSEFGNGAPALIGLMEELRILGVENFIFIGFAGLIDRKTKENTFVVTNTFSTSGTTYFYSVKNNFTPKSSYWFEFFCSKLNFNSTTCWSTDVPFRETKTLVSYFLEKHVTHIDMECASVYAFAEFYKLNSICIVISADEIIDFVWKEPINIKNINLEMKEVIKKIISINYAT